MQGRLLPKYKGRYQAHPIGSWQQEFAIAKSLGLDCIEFILDFNEAHINPLIRNGGVKELKQLMQSTGVMVKSVCADYFMEAPLHSADSNVSQISIEVLRTLLKSAVELDIKDIVIPCVDQSSLNGDEDVKRFVAVIQQMREEIEASGVNLSLETDLAPASFVALLDKLDCQAIKVNYDIGNSASLGFDPVEELDAYGHRISDIHIKDRTLGGGSVVLGQGNADFDRFFTKLKEFDYQGPFIMQAYRDEEGIEIFKQQLEWVSKYLNGVDA